MEASCSSAGIAVPPKNSAGGVPRGELLMLCHRIPYPPDKGEKIRAWHMLRHLAEKGWRVHLGALVDDPKDMVHLAMLESVCASVALVPHNARLSRLRSPFGVLRGTSMSVEYFRHTPLQRWVNSVLADRAIAAVLCVCSPMAEYVFGSPALGASALQWPGLVMDFMDVDSEKWGDYARRTRSPMRWIYALEQRLLRAYEARVARRFDAVLLVSDAEANLFRQNVSMLGECIAVRNGVDMAYFSPLPESMAFPGQASESASGPVLGSAGDSDVPRQISVPSVSSQTPVGHKDADGGGHASADMVPEMVFCGAMDYPPNVDAVEWFARAALPHIRTAVPNAVFRVVGSNPTERVRALEALPGVEVTGRVPDVRPFVSRAALSVAPLRIARGVQNKVLEAMSMERAVLATPEAIAGLEAEPDRDVRVAAAEPELFAREAVALLTDRQTARRMGRNAREAVERNYGWEECLEPLDALLCSVAAVPCGSGQYARKPGMGGLGGKPKGA